jgi:IS605 OrfB family transposase
MTNEMMLTYQTRLLLNEKEERILQECALLFNLVEHSLYAETMRGKSTASCKNTFLKTYGITARQFNACRVTLEGKISACKASKENALLALRQKIDSLEKQIQSLEKRPSKNAVLHQKKRRKTILSQRLSSLKEDLAQGRIRLCFGGKKLFNAQFHLEKNGFSSHQEWKEAWEFNRNSEFFVLGSKDETSGNQTCKSKVQESGKFAFCLRLPGALEEKYGKYLEIKNVSFTYGNEAILASLNASEGQALSYRFKRDLKGWRVFVSTALKKPEIISKEGVGVIGIDLNADHIAYVETDRYGNPIERKIISWVSYGKTREQLKAITGDICKEIVSQARLRKKPLVIEKLDFQKKRLFLKEKGNNKLARLLSSFAYGLFFLCLMARAYKNGVAVHRVNPAYTSIIGRVNYARRYGLSIHLAAALCIARRYQNFSEAPRSPEGKIPDGKGGYVAFVLPVRNRMKHVWTFWGQVKRKLTTVLAAHFRAIRDRSSSPLNSALEIESSRLLLV